MTILHPKTGKPTTSSRKTLLLVEIRDQQPGAPDAQRAQLGFELDKPDRAAVRQLLGKISSQIMQRLEETSFFETPSPPRHEHRRSNIIEQLP